ncbi:MAG TPA: hypothetical protein VGD90_07245 [Sphingobacteriaceae bacterium]
MKKFVLLVAISLLVLQVVGQERSARKQAKKTGTERSYLIMGLESSTTPYINTSTLDSSRTAIYFSGYLNYQHKSNFGARVKTYATPEGNTGFYLTSLTGFYTNYRSRITPMIAYSRHIQHNRSSIPYTPIQNELYGQIRLPLYVINIYTGADLGFGKDEDAGDENVTDFNAFAGISKFLYWRSDVRKTALGFSPSLQLNAGTDRYFNYLRSTRYISRGGSITDLRHGRQSGNGPRQNGTSREYTLNSANKFALSNVEANLYLLFSKGAFSLEPSGSLYFPTRGSDRKAYGYWQLNVDYVFPRK